MTRNLRKLYSAALAMLVTLLLPVVVLAAGKEIIILHTNDIHCGVADNLEELQQQMMISTNQ